MIKSCLFFFPAFLILSHTKAQTSGENLINNEEPFSYVEVMPAFKGGQDAMYKYIFGHITYPAVARENAIQGMVIVQFVVDVDSVLKRIHILRGIGGGCDEEVLKLMDQMNADKMWIPGRHSDRAVPVLFTLPVSFKLKGIKGKKSKSKK